MLKDILATGRRSDIERWCRERVRTAAMPDGRTLVRVLGEHPMVVDLRDTSVAPHLALDGYWEIWLSMCLAKRLKPGWRCIDVGANFGYFTLLMALITGAEVEAWEPNPDFHYPIEAMLAMNGLERQVKLIKAAASDDGGSRGLHLAEHNWGSASIGDIGNGIIPVRTGRIDVNTVLPAVDFVKIDVEGHEEHVWRGMSKILERGEPKAMLMEWTPSRYEAPADFLSRIMSAGFRAMVVDADGDLKPPPDDLTTMSGHTDLWLER